MHVYVLIAICIAVTQVVTQVQTAAVEERGPKKCEDYSECPPGQFCSMIDSLCARKPCTMADGPYHCGEGATCNIYLLECYPN